MKPAVCCLCLCLVLSGTVAVASASPDQVSPSVWEKISEYAAWLFPRPEPAGVPDAVLNTWGLSYQCMVPGTFNIASIYMQNTGNMTWSEADSIRLGAVGESGGDAAKFGPLRVRIGNGTEILTGERYEFQVPLTAPQAAGNYSPSWRMIREGHGSFGDTVTIPIRVTSPCPEPALSNVWNGWYVPADAPGEMTAGQVREARIMVMNTGTTIWNESGKIRLGAVGDSSGDAAKFGVGRVLLPAGTDVKGIVNGQAVEDQYWFTFTVVAPQAPGLYKPAFRMVREGDQWFGPVLTVPIRVKAYTPVPAYNSSIVSWDAPAIRSGTVTSGREISIRIMVLNTGTATWNRGYPQPWTSGDIGMNSDVNRIDPQNFSVTNNGNVLIDCVRNGFYGLSVIPGDSCQVTFRLIAPAAPGSYDMHFRMTRLENGTIPNDFGGNLTLSFVVGNTTPLHRIPVGINQTPPESLLNLQVSGSSGAVHASPPSMVPLKPEAAGTLAPPTATPRVVQVSLRPVGTLPVIPAKTILATGTPQESPAPLPAGVQEVRNVPSTVRLYPSAALNVTPVTGTAPLTVTCDASASTPGAGTLQSFAWDFGDGATAGGVRVTHVYPAAGNYTITLLVANTAGGTATAVQQVAVSPAVPVQVVRTMVVRPPVRLPY